MNWLEVTVNAENVDLDWLCSLLDGLGAGGLVIEDQSDFETFLKENREYWDYVDEELLREKEGVSRVKFYLSDDEQGRSLLESIRSEISKAGLSLSVAPVREEDWENNWQKYYRPMEIGRKLLIVPEWEEIPPHEGRVVLRLNPGMIFGTGSHATTRMCLEEIEKYAGPGKKVLDLGCGSGILAIAALLLGCGSALGCDIDPKAPDTALSNAALSGIGAERFKVYAGDVLKDHKLRKIIGEAKYELICANIVADVIIALAKDARAWLAENGRFVCSGIIEGRQDEVRDALIKSGLRIIETRNEEDWYCFSACLP